jgi:predicted metalloprotease with PDZ domain
LRPAALRKYDYEKEQLFDELWIAEGITSYYDDLLVARSGLMTKDEYLERLSKTIAGLQGTAGRKVQNLADSSRDAWIKLYRPDENASNARISYYVKGAVVAALLDAQIRRKTGGQRSLDDVMRRLWQDHLGTGYTEADFQKIVESIAGPEVVSWLVRLIHSTEELDYAPLLETYGLQFKPAKIPAADDTQEVFLGADAAMVDGRLTVKRIQRDSPAYRAGLNVDDEWIALNDFRVGNDWNDRLLLHQPGDEVQLLISRRNKLMRLPVRLAAKPSANWKLETVPTATPEQKTQLAQWLQLEPDPKNDAVQQPSGAENAK